MSAQFERIADFVLNLKARDIPSVSMDAAALLLLDTMGIAIASTPMQAGVIARNTANALYATNDPAMRAAMLFDGREVSLAGAAFAAATQIDNLDSHDGYAPCKGHIGVAILSALVALMQRAPDMSGPNALAHVIAGYEIAGRAGVALHGTVSDYHTSGAWNALGVAAIGARIRGLNRTQLRDALGIAEYHGPRSQMMREIANPTMLHDGSGMGAFVGVSAVIMAAQGFAGAPAITVENDETSVYWADLGQSWLIDRQYVKPYPICRWAHGAIEALRKVMEENALTAADIAHVEVRSFREAAALFRGVPDTTSLAQYSLPFAVAAFAVHRRIGVEQIDGAGLSDPQTLDFLRRISVVESDAHNALFPAHRTADVSVTLTDGRILESGIVDARGSAVGEMDPNDILSKYDDFAVNLAGRARAAAIRNAILSLIFAQSRLADLVPLIFQPL